MPAERRVRGRSSREVSDPRKYPKAPSGTNALLRPLAGSTFGKFDVPGQDFILVLEETGRACEGGTCVEVIANFSTEDGEVIFQAHIAGNDQVRSWGAWRRYPLPSEKRVELVKLDTALQMLSDRLADNPRRNLIPTT